MAVAEAAAMEAAVAVEAAAVVTAAEAAATAEVVVAAEAVAVAEVAVVAAAEVVGRPLSSYSGRFVRNAGRRSSPWGRFERYLHTMDLKIYFELFLVTLGGPYAGAVLIIIMLASNHRDRQTRMRVGTIGVLWCSVVAAFVNFLYADVPFRIILFFIATFAGIAFGRFFDRIMQS